MEIKDYKIIRKETHNIDVYNIKIREFIFNIIPVWVYLREYHMEGDYSITKPLSEYGIILVIIVLLNMYFSIFGVWFNMTFGIPSAIVGSYSFLWNIIDFEKIEKSVTYVGDSEENIKDFAMGYIDKFNRIHNRGLNKKKEVFTTRTEKDNKYYNIKIPKIDIKKFIY